jgi:hypothetical protein
MTVGSGRNAFTELIVTIRPVSRASRCGRAARVVRTAARKFMVSDQVQSSSVRARKPSSRGRTAPTLLTRTSSRPTVAIASSTT